MVSDSNAASSRSARARARRMALLCGRLQARGLTDLEALDLGGTLEYWEMQLPHVPAGLFSEIDVLNPLAGEERVVEKRGVRLRVYRGDALKADSFRRPAYDFIHSNSVIEHLENLEAQREMAAHVRERARWYWVQTPARCFPIEPHFYFPFFAYLPLVLRAWLHQRMRLGWFERQPDRYQAEADCRQIRLLTEREMISLFPDGALLQERWFGLVKSYIATNL